ncbi:hypothetical protein L9F63_005445, partial [Diploptera punctata]
VYPVNRLEPTRSDLSDRDRIRDTFFTIPFQMENCYREDVSLESVMEYVQKYINNWKSHNSKSHTSLLPPRQKIVGTSKKALDGKFLFETNTINVFCFTKLPYNFYFLFHLYDSLANLYKFRRKKKWFKQHPCAVKNTECM